MKQFAIAAILIIWTVPVICQNTIGLPQIINYNNADFHGGSQTWDIKQDSRGVMYFANNDGLISFDGSYWKVYPVPNKTILRSLAIDKDDRIYAGAQDEFGYFKPDEKGVLHYTSLKYLIPKPQGQFADVWDIELYGESVFFRATDRIFEFKNNTIRVYNTTTEWRFLKQVGSKLLAQDRTQGLVQFKDNGWYPWGIKKPFDSILVSGITELGKDSFLISTLRNGLYMSANDSITKKLTQADAELVSSLVYTTARINKTEFVVGTTSEGCLVLNYEGRIVQKIAHAEGLQNNNVLCVFLDKDNNLWAGLNNGISFIAYNSAIKYIRPNKNNDHAGYSSRIYNNQLYFATSDGAYSVALNDESKDLSFSKGEFTQIKNSGGQVWHLDEVNQQLLMGYNEGAYIIKNNEAFPLSQETGVWQFLPVSAVFPSKDIIAGTYTGLHLFGFGGDKFVDNGRIAGLYESFRFLAIDNNNDIWSSHPYRGIYKLQLSPDQKSYTSQLLTDKDGLPSALGNYVYKIKNRVVFATEKGVYEFDDASKRFIPSSFLGDIFANMEVRYLHEDGDGNIWFCSGKKVGVLCFNKSSNGKAFTITYFPELTGQVLTGFENIYPYNKQNIFIGSEKGIIHLNYEKYSSNSFKPSVLLGQVKAIGSADTIIFGGYAGRSEAGPYKQEKKDVLHLPNSYNSFHFEYSSPAYGLQNNIEYSYKLSGYDERWSAWSARTEKDYTNLADGTYSFEVKARDNLGNESDVTIYSFVVKAAWYNTIWAYLFYGLLFLLLLYFLSRWQKKKMYGQQVKFDEEQSRLKYIHQLELEKNEKEIIKLQNEKLAGEVLFKNKELADVTMHLVERGDALAKVKDELQKLSRTNSNNQDVKKAIQLLNDIEKNNSNWEQFASHFDEVNNDFLRKVKARYPALSNTDLKVCAYLQLNLSSKEIAQLMNISVRGVEISRYRLRKKLQIPEKQTLNDFLNNIN